MRSTQCLTQTLTLTRTLLTCAGCGMTAGAVSAIGASAAAASDVSVPMSRRASAAACSAVSPVLALASGSATGRDPVPYGIQWVARVHASVMIRVACTATVARVKLVTPAVEPASWNTLRVLVRLFIFVSHDQGGFHYPAQHAEGEMKLNQGVTHWLRACCTLLRTSDMLARDRGRHSGAHDEGLRVG